MINDSIIEGLLNEEESNTLDFKRDQYKFERESDTVKSELLKDILTFVNSWRRSDAYILIGVKEEKGRRSNPVGVNDHLDDANLQQFVSSKTQRPVEFSYRAYTFENLSIGVIHIPIQERPVFLTKDYGKLSKNAVYTRRGSSTSIASPDEISKMGASQSISSTQIEVGFENNRTLTKELSVEVTNLKVLSIPDYGSKGNYPLYDISYKRDNWNYYRELVDLYSFQLGKKDCKIIISNSSSISLESVEIELIIKDPENIINIKERSKLPDFPPKQKDPIANLASITSKITPLKMQVARQMMSIENINGNRRILYKINHILPGKTEILEDLFYLGATKSIAFKPKATLYAKNLPNPFSYELDVNIKVLDIEMEWTDFVRDMKLDEEL